MDNLLTRIQTIRNSWSSAVIAKDINSVMALYHSQATLKPTLSNEVRTEHEGIKRYFVGGGEDQGFLGNDITKVDFLINHPLKSDEHIFDIGEYHFHTKNGLVKASHTFVYKEENGELRIIIQHSSLCL